MKSVKRLKRRLSIWLCIIILVAMPMPNQTEWIYAATNLQASVIRSYVEAKVGRSYPNGMCLQFVEECYQALGAARPYNCCASKSGNNYIRSTSLANIPVGATVYFGNCGGGPCRTCGSSYYGHVGIYVGNGYFVHATDGRVQKSTLSSWANKYRGYGYCGNFTLINNAESDNCSCSASYAGDYTVTANGVLNMRNGHGTGYSVAASIPSGTIVYVTKSDGQWAHVEWNGRSGYCSMQYLSKVNQVGAPQIQTWVSDTKMGNMSSGFKKGNWYYLCYKLVDLKSGKLYGEAGGQANYSVTETIYNPDGSAAVMQNYGKSDHNWVAIRADSVGTYKGVVRVTGDFEGESTVNFEIARNMRPGIRVWFSDSQMGTGQTNGKKGNTYYLCYELLDLDTNRRLNESSPGDYKTTETIYKPDGSRVFTYSYDKSDYNWIRSTFDGTGTYKGTVRAIVDGKAVEGSAQIDISEPLIFRQDLYYGDMDGDGKATVSDLSFINQAANGKITMTSDEKKRADLNGDGYVNQEDIELIKQFIVGLINEFPVERQLGSISITKKPSKTTYMIGETLNTDGMTVIANYNNGKSKAVTGYKVTGSTASAGRHQVRVSYTESGITKTASYDIQVERRQGKSVSLTYDLNGGSGGPDTQKAEMGAKIRLSYTTPVRYYTVKLNPAGGKVDTDRIRLQAKFYGWTDKRAVLSGLRQPGEYIALSSDTTLYAYYTSVRLGDLPTPSAPSDEYIFKGWYYEKSKVSANTKIGTDCQLTAKWEKSENIQDTENDRNDTSTDIMPDTEKDQTQQTDTAKPDGNTEWDDGELEEINDSNIETDDILPDQNLTDQDQQNQELPDGDQNGQDRFEPDQNGDISTDETVSDDDDRQNNDGSQGSYDTDVDNRTDDVLSDENTDEGKDEKSDVKDSNEDEECAVEWNVTSVVLQKGKITEVVKAYVTGDDEIVRYQTSNPSVVAVSTSGKIKGKKVGKARVRVVTQRGNTAIVRIKVQKKAVKTKKITVNKKNVSLKIGKNFQLETDVTPITSSQKIRYLSSNSKVAAVNKQGRIKAKKKGSAVIYVKSGKKTVKVKIVVK